MGTTFPSYDYGTSISESTTAFSALGGTFLIIFLALMFVLLAWAVIATVFQGIGILKMHQKLGLKGGWMAFVPVLSNFAVGKVAEQYIKANGKKSAKFSVILIIGQIISLIFVFAMVALLLFAAMLLPASVYVIFDFVLTIAAYGLSFVLSIIFYIALWRIYAIFSNKNATLFLILSIFFPVVQPFMIFAIRNNEPLCVELTVEEIPEAVEVTE